MSWLSQISGQDAASSAQKQAGKNAQVQGTYAKLFGGAAQDYDLLHSIFGQMNVPGQIGHALNAINQDPGQQIAKQGAGNNERAAQQASVTAQFMKSQGFGDGLTAGATAGAFQNAATQTNQYAQDVNSPEYRQRQLMALLQAIQQAQGTALNPLQSFGSGAYSAPQVQQNNPLASYLGMFAGSL